MGKLYFMTDEKVVGNHVVFCSMVHAYSFSSQRPPFGSDFLVWAGACIFETLIWLAPMV